MAVRERAEATDAESADRRVVLRPLSEDDVNTMVSWNEGTQGLGQRLREAVRDDVLGLMAITFREDGRPIGVMEYRVGVPEGGWLAFHFVDVEPPLRGLGLDAEAVRLVEDEALGRGLAQRLWARLHANDGLGLYFWLRLGYRPARSEEDLWRGHRPRGIIAMIREFESLGPITRICHSERP